MGDAHGRLAGRRIGARRSRPAIQMCARARADRPTVAGFASNPFAPGALTPRAMRAGMRESRATEKGTPRAEFSFQRIQHGASRLARRRPTLPLTHASSTIGSGGLDFRVRDGIGYGPSDVATGRCRSVSLDQWGRERRQGMSLLLPTLSSNRPRRSPETGGTNIDVCLRDRSSLTDLLVRVSSARHRASTPRLLPRSLRGAFRGLEARDTWS
jgi:hypothetical protein